MSSAHEKWGQKQKCCIYNFVQYYMCVCARVSKQRINIKSVQMNIYSGLFPLTKFM